MSRPPVFPVEDKIRIVLSVLAGEMTIAEAARRNKTSETSIGKWKQFIEAGKLGLAAGGSSRPSSREQALEAEVAELTTALGEAHVELQVSPAGSAPAAELACSGGRQPRRSRCIAARGAAYTVTVVA